VNDNRPTGRPSGSPPIGGGTGRRRARCRYASDAEVSRAAELALKLGVAIELTPDGGLKILGRLDSKAPGGLPSGTGGSDADDYEAWKQENGAAGRK
jgi:hypothetical protein